MTEDDTFRKLKQIPFFEMERIFNDKFQEWASSVSSCGRPGLTTKELEDWNKTADDLLDKYGYTAQSFNAASLINYNDGYKYKNVSI